MVIKKGDLGEVHIKKYGQCHHKTVTHRKSLVIDPYFGDYLNQLEPLVSSIPGINAIVP